MHNDKLFESWLSLRETFRNAKRNKDYLNVIATGEKIIKLADNASFIGIVVPLFERDMGKAFSKLGNHPEAMKHFSLAIEGFRKYRKAHGTESSEEWMKDIVSLEKEVAKIMRK